MTYENRPGIVTPEAVVLEFEGAGLGSRGLGFLLDLLVQMTALFGLILAAGLVSTAISEVLGVVLLLLLLFSVLFVYPALMETLWGGRTLGHAALGLRVVTREGAPCRFRHAAIRSVFRFVEGILLLGFPAVLAMLFTTRNQRFGDLVAGTIVVRERSAAGTATAVVFPPPYGYEPYVASLDVGALGTEQYGVVRSFLLRANRFSPSARPHLALRIAQPVAERLHHTPPPQVPPELFLACVASAYQQRHQIPGAFAPPPVAPAPTPPTWSAPPPWPGPSAPPTGQPPTGQPPTAHPPTGPPPGRYP